MMIVMSEVRVSYPTLNREQVVEGLRKACTRLEKRLPVSKIILYGSYAVGQYTVGSDIDLIVVYKGSSRDDAFKIVMNEIRLPRLEPKVYAEEQFSRMIAQSPKFAETLEKEGVVIFES